VNLVDDVNYGVIWTIDVVILNSLSDNLPFNNLLLWNIDNYIIWNVDGSSLFDLIVLVNIIDDLILMDDVNYLLNNMFSWNFNNNFNWDFYVNVSCDWYINNSLLNNVIWDLNVDVSVLKYFILVDNVNWAFYNILNWVFNNLLLSNISIVNNFLFDGDWDLDIDVDWPFNIDVSGDWYALLNDSILFDNLLNFSFMGNNLCGVWLVADSWDLLVNGLIDWDFLMDLLFNFSGNLVDDWFLVDLFDDNWSLCDVLYFSFNDIVNWLFNNFFFWDIINI
jgi:hypothetical protein